MLTIKDFVSTYNGRWYPDGSEMSKELGRLIEDDAFVEFFEIIRSVEELEKCLPLSEEDTFILREFYARCIEALESKKVYEDRTSPFYFELIRLRFRQSVLEGIKDARRLIKAIDWQRVCLNFDDDKHNIFYFQLSGHDRESELWNASCEQDQNRQWQLRYFDPEKPGWDIGKIYAKIQAEWFLKRYDLETARKLTNWINPQRLLGRLLTLFVLSPLKMVPLVALVLLMAAHLWKDDFWIEIFGNVNAPQWFPLAVSQSTFSELDKLAYKADGVWLVHDAPEVVVILFLIYLALVAMLLASFLVRKNILWLRMLVPRLIGGIIVGYFPLLMSEEIWKFVLKLDWPAAVVLVAASLALSFLYLRVEVSNVVESAVEFEATQGGWLRKALRTLLGQRRSPQARTWKLFWMGLFYSFVIGLVVADLVSLRMVTNISPAYVALHPTCGFLGVIYPKIVLVFSPLALLIGIFVQIIWEDKPITQPL